MIGKIGKPAKMGKARSIQERMHALTKKQVIEKAKRARRKNPNGQIEGVGPSHCSSKRKPLPGRAKR